MRSRRTSRGRQDRPSKPLLSRRVKSAGVLALLCLLLDVVQEPDRGHIVVAMDVAVVILLMAQCSIVSGLLALALAFGVGRVGRRAIVGALIRLDTHSNEKGGSSSQRSQLRAKRSRVG